MPIHIIRDVALTIRSFYKRINDFVRYRQATKDMNDRYPDATPEEVAQEDVCIICREDMRAWGPPAQDANAPQQPPPTALDERNRPKKLPCGHILHFACLRSWLERQQNCPTCRRPVLVPSRAGPPGAVNAADQNVGAGPQHNQQNPPNAGQAGGQQPVIAHNVFNLGPFRLAFGARIGQGVPPPLNHNHPAGLIQQGQAPNPQGLGTGFGLFRQPQQSTTASFTPLNVPAQLQQLEQQIMREVNALHVQADQLYLVRSLQGELARLRIQQAQANVVSNGLVIPPVLQHGPSNSNPPNPLPPGVQAQNIPRAFTAGVQQQPLGPGRPELPPGMTLPEGWTVLPLQRVNQVSPMVFNSAGQAQGAVVPTPTAGWSLGQSLSTDPSSSTNPNQTPMTTALEQDTGQPSTNAGSEPVVNGYTDPSFSHPSVEVGSTPQPQSLNTDISEQSSQESTAPSIPNWGSTSASQKGHASTTHDDNSMAAHKSVDGDAMAPDGDTEDNEATTAERREAKGKGKAVTVEDLVDDVD